MNQRTLIPLIVSALILCGAGALYGLGYYGLAQSRTKATSLATDITTKTQQLDRAARARAALSTLSTDEATTNQYFLGKEDIVPFLETLQAGGKSLGSKITVMSVADVKAPTHNRIALSLTITGSFDSVMRTLGAIEYGPYDGTVSNLTLETQGTTGTEAPLWTANAILSLGARTASSTPKNP